MTRCWRFVTATWAAILVFTVIVVVLSVFGFLARAARADNAALSVSLDAASPGERIATPGPGQIYAFAALRCGATGGDVWLTHLPLELNRGAPSDVGLVSVWNGGNLVGEGTFESSTLQVFLSRTVWIPQDGQVALTVRAQIASGVTNGTAVAINFNGDGQTVAYDIRGNLVSAQGGDTNAPGVRVMSSYPTFAPFPLGDTDDDGDDGSSSRVSLRAARRIMGDNLIGPRFPRQWGIRLSPRERRLLNKVPFSRSELKSKRYTHLLIAGRRLTRGHIYNWMAARDLIGTLPLGDLGNTPPAGNPAEEIRSTWFLIPVDRSIAESRLLGMNVAEKGYCNLVYYSATNRVFFTDEELKDPPGAGPPPAGRFFPGRELGRWSVTANGGFLTTHQFTFKVARAAVPDPLGISIVNLKIFASDTPDFVSETQFGGTIAALPSDNSAEIAIWSTSTAPEAQAPESVRYFRLTGDVTLSSDVGAIATQLLGDGAYPALQTPMRTIAELSADPNHRFLWAPGISVPEDRNWTNGFIVPGLPADGLSWSVLLE